MDKTRGVPIALHFIGTDGTHLIRPAFLNEEEGEITTYFNSTHPSAETAENYARKIQEDGDEGLCSGTYEPV
jgi:hypothetical protein